MGDGFLPLETVEDIANRKPGYHCCQEHAKALAEEVLAYRRLLEWPGQTSEYVRLICDGYTDLLHRSESLIDELDRRQREAVQLNREALERIQRILK